MEIRSYCHAAFQIKTSQGVRLLSDPWLYSPIYGNMMWQFPACSIPRNEYVDQDAIYISHDHPDHFCERTLDLFDRRIPVLIRRYGAHVPIKATLERLGFSRIVELDDRQTSEPLPGLEVTVLADPNNTDSSLIVSDGERTILNQNDCKGSDEMWTWVGANFSIDLSLQSYGATNLFPGSYEMSHADKMSALRRRTEHQLSNAMKLARMIKTPLVVPAANDLALMLRPDLDDFYAAVPIEFRNRAVAEGCSFEVLLLSPGERFTFKESPKSHPGLFKSKADFLAQLAHARKETDIVETGRRLAAWEREFSLYPSVFLDRMQNYCRESLSLGFPGLKPSGDIAVGLRVSDGPRETRFKISYGSTRRSVVENAGALDPTDLHMIVTVDGNLLAMALAGACTFEDLMNCRWTVQRFRDYSLDEVSFWAFLSALTPYLEEKGLQPSRADRDRLKYMPPWAHS